MNQPDPARLLPGRPGLVGRGAELAVLDEALAGVADGQARCVEVVGEPGIGKTRLLLELAARASAQGRPVLWGAGTEFELHVPFGMFTNALDDHLEDTPVAELGAGRIGLLSSVFPALAGQSAGPAVADGERYLMHRAVRALLELVAQPAGLVLILDDVHWADEGSVELLDHLLRHPARGPVLLVVAYRPRQLPQRLGNAFPAAVRRRVAERLEIGPLSPQEAADLLGPKAGSGELYRASGGNPFYLEALAGLAEPEGLLGGLGDADGIAPPVRSALLAELAALTADERLVAHAVAVAGDDCEAGLVAEIAALDLPRVLAAIDTLGARDLTRSMDVPGRLRFRHPLVRHVTYEAAGAGWRISAHARAATFLAGQGVSAAGRAHHVERSAGLGDLAAVQTLTEAATATMHATPATAAHWLGVALRLLPDDPALIFQRLGLLGLRARALGVSGRVRESRDVLREVLGLLPAELADQRAGVVAFCAMIERLLGLHDEARSLLITELGSLPDRTGPAAGQLMLELASGHQFRGDFDAALDTALRALEITRATGDAPLLVASLSMCVMTSYSASRVEPQVIGWLDEAATRFDTMSDAELGRQLETATSLGWAEINLLRNEAALRHLARGLDVARGTGQNHVVPYLLLAVATAQGALGQLAEAIASADDALEAALLLDSADLRRMALTHKCWLYTWQGDLAAAVRFGEEALACEIGTGRWFSTATQLQLAQAKLHSGDPVACIELVLAAGKGPELTGIDRSAHPGTFQQLAAAEAALGHTEDALRWAKRAGEAARDIGLPAMTAQADLAFAQALMATDPAEAVVRAQAAAETFAQASNPVETARSHYLTGVGLSALGDRDRARAEFSRCRAIADECGSRLWRDRAVREERRMNARLPRKGGGAESAEPGLAALTERERDVAALVAVGLTNRQIAEKLFLSPRTVEIHLSRAFAKTGVATRAALAGIWRDAGG